MGILASCFYEKRKMRFLLSAFDIFGIIKTKGRGDEVFGCRRKRRGHRGF